MPKKSEVKFAWRCIKDHGSAAAYYYLSELIWMPKNIKMDPLYWERKKEWDRK